LIQKLNEFGEAGVLALEATPDNHRIIASGINPLCVVFDRVVRDNAPEKWVKSCYRSFLELDIFAMTVFKDLKCNADMIAFGGMSGQLKVCKVSSSAGAFGKGILKEVNSFQPDILKSTQVCAKSKLILSSSDHMIQLWKLGVPSKTKKVTITEGAVRIADVHLKSGPAVVSCALSPDGTKFAYSTVLLTKLFSIDLYKGAIEAIATLPAASSLAFDSSERLFLGRFDRKIEVYNLDSTDAPAFTMDIVDDPESASFCPFRITGLSIHQSGQWLAVNTSRKQILIYNLESREYHGTSPIVSSAIVQVKFHPLEPTLVFVSASNEFFIFEVTGLKISDLYQKLGTSLCKIEEPIMNISFNPASLSSVLFQTASKLITVDFSPVSPTEVEEVEIKDGEQSASTTSGLKRKRVTSGNAPGKNSKKQKTEQKSAFGALSNLIRVSEVKDVVLADFCGKDEIAIVECPWEHVSCHLPEPVYRHQYAT
jgi:WD40 repeat protein